MREVDIPNPIKKFATTSAVAAFRAVRALKRALQFAFSSIWKLIAPAVSFFVRYAIFPFYRLGVLVNLRIHRLALPAKGFVLFLLTNRYLFHATIILLALVTLTGNLQTRQAHAQDVGQRSLLFALATDEKNEVVEESFRPENAQPNAKYMSNSSVLAIPHIDYDYDTADSEVTSETEIPGTIAALPIDTTGETTKAPRTRTETYLVQDNDTISDIARRFGVNVGTILWNNGLDEKSFIRPGDTLKIPPVSGILVTVKSGDTLSSIANKYDGSLEEIKSFNNLGEEKIALGSEIMVPGGRPPEIEQTRSQIAARNQVLNEPKSSAISKLTSPRPVPKPADLDTKDVPKTKLLWPTPGHVITQYYGWKHIGLDIDGDFTSPLYASADGVVETAGWSNAGYGLMVFINHQNGLKTRYAHASKLFVKAGDTVKRGQVIAMMGTTGKSTGTHIHYEVYVNGKRVNPLTYIK